MRHAALCLAAVTLATWITGCAREAGRPTVSGKVTYNGRPLADKTLVLTLEGGQGVIGSLELGPDGAFSGEVPEPGTYKVSITESMAVMEGVDKAAQGGPKVAERYRSAMTSEVKVEIAAGRNEKTIELKD